LYGNIHCGKPQELKNQIGYKSGAARSRLVLALTFVMGRLLEPGSDAGARLMIEVRFIGKQNPAYRFATGTYGLFSIFWKRGFIFLHLLKLKYKKVV